jgi:hypothetical protein
VTAWSPDLDFLITSNPATSYILKSRLTRARIANNMMMANLMIYLDLIKKNIYS